MTSTPISLLERLRLPFDQDAWAEFVALYSPLVLTWGRQAGLRDEDAADLTQEVFVTLLTTLPTFTYDRNRSFSRWLRTVTLNKWRDGLKRQAKERGTVPLGSIDPLEEPDPAAAFWEVEYRSRLVARALALMQNDFEPQTWQAVWNHVVLGQPAPVVARELRLTPGAVYAAKVRVLARLRTELQGMVD